jgi:hypothetical protein
MLALGGGSAPDTATSETERQTDRGRETESRKRAREREREVIIVSQAATAGTAEAALHNRDNLSGAPAHRVMIASGRLARPGEVSPGKLRRPSLSKGDSIAQ